MNAHLCAVCTGEEPAWVGHDQQPPCRGYLVELADRAQAVNGLLADLRAAAGNHAYSLREVDQHEEMARSDFAQELLTKHGFSL